MKEGYERAVIVTEMLYNARMALAAASVAAEAFKDAPNGVEGLYALCKQVEGAWNNFMRTVPEGWHPFRSVAYLDALEDALLFVRENNQPHQWVESGVTIDTAEPFDEKHCAVCAAVNWGGNDDGVCFGNHNAELGIIAAHNRRVFKKETE